MNRSWLRLDRSKISSWVFLLTASALITIVLLELGLRFLRPVRFRPPFVAPFSDFLQIHQRSSIPGLIYELAPNREIFLDDVDYKTNRYGMRDGTPISNQTGSLRRIVVLGDGYAFGSRVPVEATFPKLLEKLLNESAKRSSDQFNVLNFGVFEYSTAQELAVLKFKTLDWNPDVVILAYNPDDPEPYPILPKSFHTYFDRPRWWQHSHLLRLLAHLRSNWEIQRLGGGDYIRYLNATQGENWKNSVKAFGAIREITSRRGIPVLVVIFPYVWQMPPGPSWPAYQYKEIHKQVSDLAIQNGFRVIDLYDVYSQSGHDPIEVIVSRKDNHPSRLGHELVARAIARELSAGHDFYFNRHRKDASQ